MRSVSDGTSAELSCQRPRLASRTSRSAGGSSTRATARAGRVRIRRENDLRSPFRNAATARSCQAGGTTAPRSPRTPRP